MNKEQKNQFSLLMSELNTYMIKIANVVYRINTAFAKIYSIEEKSNFDFFEQMNNLIKDINNIKYKELPKTNTTRSITSIKEGDQSLEISRNSWIKKTQISRPLKKSDLNDMILYLIFFYYY